MSNIINFPVCLGTKGHIRYGGHVFETQQEVLDFMSDKDWRRTSQWQSRHMERIERQREKQA
jgi:hypothetical protein